MIILSIEFAICSVELIRVIYCHNTAGECWSWFFAFIANIPASIVINSIQHFIHISFAIESFAIDSALVYMLYLLIGTLWWYFLIHLAILFYKYTSRFIIER